MSVENDQLNGDDSQDKPLILKALEMVLADPKDIKNEAIALMSKFEKAHPHKTNEKIKDLVANKIISNYSYYAAFSGGATSLTGVIPGLGTVLAMFGGGAADAALCLKFQIEMTMALATVYEHDILVEEEKRLCMLIAGLGAVSELTKESGKTVGSKAFTKMLQEYLKGSTLVAVKEVFKKFGITFTRKAAEKSIPFGIGIVIGFTANKGLTWYVGKKAKDFFSTLDDDSVVAG